MKKFQNGDRVFAVENNPVGGRMLAGDLGTVVGFENGFVGVRWDNEYIGCHDLQGRCESRHGWWVFPDAIKLAIKEQEDENLDMSDISLEDLFE